MIAKRSQIAPSVPKSTAIKGPSQRQLRVAEEIRQMLSTIFSRGELSDLELEKWSITLTRVVMSPDLKSAKVYMIPLGVNLDAEAMKALVKLLNDSTPNFRHLLSQRLTLRYAPKLKFYHDDTFEQAQRIDDLIIRARRRDELITDK